MSDLIVGIAIGAVGCGGTVWVIFFCIFEDMKTQKKFDIETARIEENKAWRKDVRNLRQDAKYYVLGTFVPAFGNAAEAYAILYWSVPDPHGILLSARGNIECQTPEDSGNVMISISLEQMSLIEALRGPKGLWPNRAVRIVPRGDNIEILSPTH